DRVLMEALEETPEVAVSVERHDSAAAEIPNQKLACVFAESTRRKSKSPWRIDKLKLAPCIRSRYEAGERAGLRIKCVNQSVAAALDVILFIFVLFGKGHEDHAVDGLHI